MAAADAIRGGVRTPLRHDSAHKHVTGQARFIDDLPVPPGTLHVHIAWSRHAHARILGLDLSRVRDHPAVVAVLTAADVPGANDVSPGAGDDPMFAAEYVEYVGQPLFAVAALSREAAARAAGLAEIQYEPLPAIIDIDQALAADSFLMAPKVLERGDPDAAIQHAPHQVNGRLRIGGQDHFYLEGQAALALPGEDGDVEIWSSTQHPSEVQHIVARVLGKADNAVTVRVRRMGGAFGGKETQAAHFAAVAALAAHRTGRAAKVVLDRDDDMMITGKRHDFRVDYRAGFDPQGRLLGLTVDLASRCGRSADLSGPVNDRAMFHVDNCCYLEQVRIRSLRCRTHTVSNTAFRGFGGPQGMMVIEQVMDHIAAELQLDPLMVRRANFYDREQRNTTPYGMVVEDNILPELVDQLVERADYHRRRQAVAAFNARSPVLKKGLALTTVKFGISFTTTFLNQAGALVHIYTDGSVHLNHGGTEMGQGLNTKVAQVVAAELNIDVDRVKITATSTGKVPNTSATAASSGSDLNGKAAQAAARKIRRRLVRHAMSRWQVGEADVEFLPNRVRVGEREMSLAELVQSGWRGRVSLSATGYYRTPKIAYDAQTGRGRPFYYFAYGAAVSEVIIDTLTGESRVERVDILHDVGDSLNPAIDRGQIEGGFVQGMGWLTSEELVFGADGALLTHAPSTYKIPTCGDRPRELRIELLADSPNRENAIFRSKAVGEPPLMLAISVFRALVDAVAAAADHRAMPLLDAPATPERILAAVEQLRQQRLEQPEPRRGLA